MKAYFSNSWAEIKAGFSGGISGILTVLANFSPIGLIYQAFAGVLNYLGVDMPARFTEFGGMIISGLVKGLTAGFGAVKDAISSIGTSTIGWFKEKLGIHSPSRVFAELGGFTTEGLAQGLERGSKEPLDAIAKLGQQLSQAGSFELSAATLQLDGARPEVSRPPGVPPLTAIASPASDPEPTVGLSPEASSLAAALVGMNRTLASGDDTKPNTPRPPVIQPLAATVALAGTAEPTQGPSPDASSLAAALVGMSRTLASGNDTKPDTPRPPVIQPLAVTVAPAAATEPAQGPSPDTSTLAAALVGMSRTLASGDDARRDTPRPPVIQPLTVAASPVVPAEPAQDPAPDISSLAAALVGMSRTLANGAEAKPAIQLKPAVQVQAAAEGSESAAKESWFADRLSAFTEALALVNPFRTQTQAVKPGPEIQPPARIEPNYPEEGATLPASLASGMTVGSKSLIGALTAMTLQLAHAGGVDARPEIPQVPSVQARSTGPLDSAPIALTVDNRPPIAAAPPVSYDSHDVYHISIPAAPGMDAQAIARAVSAELDKRDREKSARQRSRLTDLE
ncbi:hypothetical protein D3C81_1043180 [compost metagenome]